MYIVSWLFENTGLAVGQSIADCIAGKESNLNLVFNAKDTIGHKMITATSKTVTAKYDADDQILIAVWNFAPETEYWFYHVEETDGNAIASVQSLGAYMNTVIKPKYTTVEKILI